MILEIHNTTIPLSKDKDQLCIKHLLLAEGTILGITGNNGAGKSTFLQVLLGLNSFEGSIKIFNNLPGIKNNWIGYLEQNPIRHLPKRIIVQELIQQNINPLSLLWSTPDHIKIANVLELTGTEHLLHKPFNQLSGGEQKRVLIAQTIVNTPRLLILDEPMNSVDQVSKRTINNTLLHLKSQGIATIIVSHEINTISCDKILHFQNKTAHLCSKPII